MKVKEWLHTKDKNTNVTFIIAKAVKDETSPFYHTEYRTTPIRSVWEWLEGETAENYIVIKADHPPIDATGSWNDWYLKSHLLCAMIATEQDLITRYGEKQGNEMIEYYDNKLR